MTLQGLGLDFKIKTLFDAQERAGGKRGADLGVSVLALSHRSGVYC